MTTIYRQGEAARRFASLRTRSSARARLADLAGITEMPGCVEPLDVRVCYKIRSSPPLGDFPRLSEGMVVSQRVVDVLAPGAADMFALLPLKVNSGGHEMPSRIWHDAPSEEWKRIKGVTASYFLLHPVKTFIKTSPRPVPPQGVPGDGDDLDLAAAAKWIAAQMNAMNSEAEDMAEFFRDRPIPPLFAFGSLGHCYFTDGFAALAQKRKLKGLTCERVVDV